jgi:SAM-dependent methyltransferase
VTKCAIADESAGNLDLLAQSWRSNAARWSTAVRKGQIESRKNITDAAILTAILRHKPSNVLDLGCGEGWLCRALGSHVPYRVGIDASPELLELGRAIGGADFMLLSYTDMIRNPLAAGDKFDVIAANFSLLDECTEQLFATLIQAVRVGGKLVVQTVHPWNVAGDYRSGWRTESFELLSAEQWTPMPWYFRTLESWISTFGNRWRLDSIEEPCTDDSSHPVSLIFTASKDSV